MTFNEINVKSCPNTSLTKILFIVFAMLISLSSYALPIISQHDTNNTSGEIFARDLEFFGVSDTLEFKGTTDHDLDILGGPSVHTIHTFNVGDKFQFNTRMEFSATRFGDDDRDGRPLFVPVGEGELSPSVSNLVGLTAPNRELSIRNHDTLFGTGMAGAIFDYSMPWTVSVLDGIAPSTQTTTTNLGLSGGGAGAGFQVAVTKALTSPTTVTVAKGFDDLFEFELSQPQNQGGVNSDAKQGFFAEGGTLVVSGFLTAVEEIMESVIWFDNNTAVSYDEIFEFQDPNPGLGMDEGIPGGVGDLLLNADVRTVPWDKYEIIAAKVPEPMTVHLLAIGLLCIIVTRRRSLSLGVE